MSERIYHDADGNEARVPLTPEEQADREALAVQAAAEEDERSQREQRRDTMAARLVALSGTNPASNAELVRRLRRVERVLGLVLPFIDVDPGDDPG